MFVDAEVKKVDAGATVNAEEEGSEVLDAQEEGGTFVLFCRGDTVRSLTATATIEGCGKEEFSVWPSLNIAVAIDEAVDDYQKLRPNLERCAKFGPKGQLLGREKVVNHFQRCRRLRNMPLTRRIV